MYCEFTVEQGYTQEEVDKCNQQLVKELKGCFGFEFNTDTPEEELGENYKLIIRLFRKRVEKRLERDIWSI